MKIFRAVHWLHINSYWLSWSRGILSAAQSLRKENSMAGQKFYWLASDGWGKQSQVVKGLEDFAVGAITVELESKKISGNCLFSWKFHINLSSKWVAIYHGNFSTLFVLLSKFSRKVVFFHELIAKLPRKSIWPWVLSTISMKITYLPELWSFF